MARKTPQGREGKTRAARRTGKEEEGLRGIAKRDERRGLGHRFGHLRVGRVNIPEDMANGGCERYRNEQGTQREEN